ncbi:hypothetical protein NDI56_04620 [Haloarcula sp. S1CR25-12]|uniref:Uncharacterized protein n=1 Tax=Haloarcula saliterrae TaxID=2950534 RepID=A0ABU2F9T8_9EURY|nr:hypothetical protein [Haloarcula sp. S1CR25-12]MDS0258693.1 hypothetical protein [Haloarcula sp. S1CR25-12]
MTGVSREQLIADLRAADKEAAGPPTVSTVPAECEGTIREYVSTFDTWYGALEAAGLAADISPPGVDQETLVEDLQRVASKIDRSPTGDHIADHGDYDIETYELVFGSYVLALEAAGIDPETTQYNFSEVEPPEHRDTTKNVRYLREHGPTPSSEMPLGSSVSDRKHGMWRFVMTSGQGSTDNGGGATEAVYYLDDQHDAKSVLRTFFETNDALVRNKSRHGIILGVRNHSPDWVDTAKDLLNDIAAASDHTDETDVGVLVVTPTDDTLVQGVARTVETPVENINVIEGVDADSGYVLGMPEEQQALWNRVNTGDIVMSQTETGVHTFTVEQTVRDWNATPDLWAEYDDGVRVAGPDRPWPYLLVGTTGSEIDLDLQTFWNAVSADETSEQIQYVPEEALAELRAESDTFWNFVSERTEHNDVGANQHHAEDAEKNSPANNTRHTTDASASENITVEIDSTIAFLISDQQSDDVASLVGAHLKQAVDGIDPATSAVTSTSTTAVRVELTGTQRTLIRALCGEDADYKSIDAFVEDAIRTHLEIPDTEEEFSISLSGTTAMVLERLVERDGTEINDLLSEQIAELVAKRI